jgi:hypothetical protein
LARTRPAKKTVRLLQGGGGNCSAQFPPDKDRLSHDADEIDLRNSRLTDAELKYIIALKPQRRLRLGAGVSDEGMKKLRQALPDCKIER